MSYSRWSTSGWYTYMRVDDLKFVISGYGAYEPEELTPELLDGFRSDGYSQEQLDELQGYVDRYLADRRNSTCEGMPL